MTGSHLQVRLAPVKCRECICGIQESTGIWCALMKKTPSAREVELCRRFCPKAILDQPRTSSGRRDAWAVGHNYRYAIGVWVGRFRGTGRLEYVGAEAAEPLLCRLFCLPQLRVEADPPAPEAIRVRRPLSLPKELVEDLRITTPGSDEIFIAVNGSTVVHAQANRDDANSWFLNGRLEGSGQARRLVLATGTYELRCVDQRGSSSTVTFTVCSPESWARRDAPVARAP